MFTIIYVFLFTSIQSKRKNFFVGDASVGQGGEGSCKQRSLLHEVAVGSILDFDYGGGNITNIIAGNKHSFVVTETLPYGFGSNANYVLGSVQMYTENNVYSVPHTVISQILNEDNPLLSESSISSFNRHTLLVDSKGDAYSFGEYVKGKLGGGPDISRDQLKPLHVGTNIWKVDTNICSSLMLNETGVYSFGCNRGGLLGFGLNQSSLWSPSLIPNLPKIVDISAGEYFSLFLDEENSLWITGTLFGVSETVYETPTKLVDSSIYGNVTLFDAGCMHLLFVTEDEDGKQNLYSAGYNRYGVLGIGSSDYVDGIQRVSTASFGEGERVLKISAGQYGNVILTDRFLNNLYYWGVDLEDPDMLLLNESILEPTRLDAGDNRFIAADVSQSGLLAVDEGKGRIWSLGSNEYLEAGRKDVSHVRSFEVANSDVIQNQSIAKIICGPRTCFGIGEDFFRGEDNLYGWGAGEYGQLGKGEYLDHLLPTNIHISGFQVETKETINEDVVDVCSSQFFTVVLTINGNVYSFGNGMEASLGLGKIMVSEYPSRIHLDNMKAKQICCGKFHVMILMDNDELFVHGKGSVGELGLGGDRRFVASPEFLMDDVVEISCRYRSCLAIKKTGDVYFWGSVDVNFHTEYFGVFTPMKLELPGGGEDEEIEMIDTAYDYIILGMYNRVTEVRTLYVLYGDDSEFKFLGSYASRRFITSSSWTHSLILFDDGSVIGFGSNHFGELLTDSATFIEFPITVDPGYEVSRVMTSDSVSFFQERVECFDILDSDARTVCSGHGVCVSEDSCVCFLGWGREDCSEIACGEPSETMNKTYTWDDYENVCHGHGNCLEGNICECDTNSQGRFCSSPYCDFECVHGICGWNEDELTSGCHCYDGFDGKSCDEYSCGGISMNNPDVCSFHDKGFAIRTNCLSLDVCDCEQPQSRNGFCDFVNRFFITSGAKWEREGSSCSLKTHPDCVGETIVFVFILIGLGFCCWCSCGWVFMCLVPGPFCVILNFCNGSLLLGVGEQWERGNVLGHAEKKFSDIDKILLQIEKHRSDSKMLKKKNKRLTRKGYIKHEGELIDEEREGGEETDILIEESEKSDVEENEVHNVHTYESQKKKSYELWAENHVFYGYPGSGEGTIFYVEKRSTLFSFLWRGKVEQKVFYPVLSGQMRSGNFHGEVREYEYESGKGQDKLSIYHQRNTLMMNEDEFSKVIRPVFTGRYEANKRNGNGRETSKDGGFVLGRWINGYLEDVSFNNYPLLEIDFRNELSDFVRIGSGGNATIYEATYQNNRVAVKIFDTSEKRLRFMNWKGCSQEDSSGCGHHKNLLRRSQVIEFCNHLGATLKRIRKKKSHYIISILGWNPSNCCLKNFGYVMKRCDQSVRDYYFSKSGRSQVIPIRLTDKILKEAAKGMEFFHDSIHLIHRDVKPANFLLKRVFQDPSQMMTVPHLVKLVDFDAGIDLFDEVSKRSEMNVSDRGTVFHISPELYLANEEEEGEDNERKTVLSGSCDVYSFGIMMYELYILQLDDPFGILRQRKCPTCGEEMKFTNLGELKAEMKKHYRLHGDKLRPRIFPEKCRKNKNLKKKKKKEGYEEIELEKIVLQDQEERGRFQEEIVEIIEDEDCEEETHEDFKRETLVKGIKGDNWRIQLMRKCWSHDPSERPSFEQVVECFRVNMKSERNSKGGGTFFIHSPSETWIQ